MFTDVKDIEHTQEVVDRLQKAQSHFGKPDVAGIIKHAKEQLEDYSSLASGAKERYFEELKKERNRVIDTISKKTQDWITKYRIEPDSEAAYHAGSHLIQAEDYGRAIDWLKTAIKHNPEHAHAHNDLGFALLRGSNFDPIFIEKALEHIKIAQELDPSIHIANLSAASDHLLYNEKTRAGEPVDYNHQGILHLQVNRFTEAEKSFRKAVEQNPKDAEALNNLAYSQLRNGEFEKAMDSAIKALELNPSLSPNNVVTLSVILDHALDFAGERKKIKR